MKKKKKSNKREEQRLSRLSPYKYTDNTLPKSVDVKITSSTSNFKLNKNGGLN